MVKEDRLGRGDPVDMEWLQRVKAVKVLRHGTPLEQVQYAAGDHQARQTGVRSLTLAEFLRLAVREGPDVPLRLVILRAVQKAGWSKDMGPV